MIFYDLHPRRPHTRKRTAAEVVVCLEEALEVAPKGLAGRLGGSPRLARGLHRSAGGGEGVATQVVVLLEEALDGVHSCFGLWTLFF